ncbi:hypothetical protein I7I50_10258 [Histoplasma capsulatum G186AR]|uniref:Uncharacterized protein n=1 Tax=Ajellomyces capsulatus TaxID=5037 RepID=A0A8H8D7C4_AJECA|nr:hypothetical protein I7I52_01497 [Histoplasma capsulatum]QSS69079.1 hypothetical protein I7I50_10258 [Histoplasma capsulatum G186AR]
MPFASSILAHKTDTNWITEGAKKKKVHGKRSVDPHLLIFSLTSTILQSERGGSVSAQCFIIHYMMCSSYMSLYLYNT